MPVEIVACQRGVAQHAPALHAELASRGVQLQTVECFDKCDTCERVLLVRIEGMMMRCKSSAELLAAVAELR